MTTYFIKYFVVLKRFTNYMKKIDTQPKKLSVTFYAKYELNFR